MSVVFELWGFHVSVGLGVRMHYATCFEDGLCGISKWLRVSVVLS